jgi:hypothetical protein
MDKAFVKPIAGGCRLHVEGFCGRAAVMKTILIVNLLRVLGANLAAVLTNSSEVFLCC